MELANRTVLDVGCGSGILSIASKYLGAEVFGCDTDELAKFETIKNFKLNGFECKNSDIWCGSIGDDKSERKYDLITANILAFVLILLYSEFKKRLKSGGVLILSGILEEYEGGVLEKFSDFAIMERRCIDGWVALKLQTKK